MSGITASTYVIENVQEREERERRAAWTEFAACRAELTALRAEADGYRSVLGKQIEKVPAGRRVSREASAARIREATEANRQVVTESRQRLLASVTEAAHDSVLRSARATQPAATTPRVASPALAPEPEPVTRRSPADLERERRAEETTRAAVEQLARRAAELLARLPAHAPPDTRDACSRVVEDIMASPSQARAHLLLTDLADAVRAAEREDEQIRATAGTLAGFAAGLDFAASDEAETLRAEIAQLIRTRALAVPAGLADRVAAAVDAADRARRRRTAAAAMRVSLDELGYTVAEGFETVLVDRGAAYASLPDRPGYGVKVLLDDGKDVIRTQIVRSSDAYGNGTDDEAAEQVFCDAYPTLLQRLRRHGVDTADVATVAPGRHSLATVDGTELPATTGVSVHRSAHQAREMGS